MTAQELAAEMHKFGITTMNRWAIDGAAMLRTQAAEIEALKADADRYRFCIDSDVFSVCVKTGERWRPIRGTSEVDNSMKGQS